MPHQPQKRDNFKKFAFTEERMNWFWQGIIERELRSLERERLRQKRREMAQKNSKNNRSAKNKC